MAKPPVEVWPDNWAAVELFITIGTQWRVGSCGVVGLDYNVLFHLMARKNLNEADFDQLLSDIRALESFALEAIDSSRTT